MALFGRKPGGNPSDKFGLSGMTPQWLPQTQAIPDQGDIAPMGMGQHDYGSAPQVKPKFFGQGGAGLKILGAIGDGMQVFAGGQATYGPAMAQQREQEQQRAYAGQRDEQNRMRAREDYLWQQQNKAPTINDTERDYAFYQKLFGDEQAKQLISRPQYITRADGKTVQIGGFNPNAQPHQNSGPQIGAVEEGHRFKGGNPADPSSWEPVGGAGPQTPYTFR